MARPGATLAEKLLDKHLAQFSAFLKGSDVVTGQEMDLDVVETPDVPSNPPAPAESNRPAPAAKVPAAAVAPPVSPTPSTAEPTPDTGRHLRQVVFTTSLQIALVQLVLEHAPYGTASHPGWVTVAEEIGKHDGWLPGAMKPSLSLRFPCSSAEKHFQQTHPSALGKSSGSATDCTSRNSRRWSGRTTAARTPSSPVCLRR
jgi:hypothetical protein